MAGSRCAWFVVVRIGVGEVHSAVHNHPPYTVDSAASEGRHSYQIVEKMCGLDHMYAKQAATDPDCCSTCLGTAEPFSRPEL